MYEDAMHDDLLGMRLDLVGSTMFELCSENVWGHPPLTGKWQDKMDCQLDQATKDFQSWCSSTGQQCSQPAFRVLNLSMHVKDDWPILRAKAHNCSVVSTWVSEICARNVYDESSEMRALCNAAAADLWKLTEATKFPNWVLTEAQTTQMRQLRAKVLLSYEWLAAYNCEQSRYRFKMRPKFHHWDHGMRRCVRTSISMSVLYCFSPEDMMGLVARMCAKCHGSSIIRRGVARWLLTFFSDTA